MKTAAELHAALDADWSKRRITLAAATRLEREADRITKAALPDERAHDALAQGTEIHERLMRAAARREAARKLYRRAQTEWTKAVRGLLGNRYTMDWIGLYCCVIIQRIPRTMAQDVVVFGRRPAGVLTERAVSLLVQAEQAELQRKRAESIKVKQEKLTALQAEYLKVQTERGQFMLQYPELRERANREKAAGNYKRAHQLRIQANYLYIKAKARHAKLAKLQAKITEHENILLLSK